MSDLLAVVNRHNEAVRTVSESRVRYRRDCAICSNDRFAPHELRRRSLRLIVANRVLIITIWVARWRCLECRRVWTDYPPFRLAVSALRHGEPARTGRPLSSRAEGDLPFRRPA